jgi:two-component system cell cycle response regulator DivK
MSNILLVDDEKTTVEILSRILTRNGHKVDVARDGVAAVKKAKDTAYDLIIMDMSMPQMTGWEATRALKGDPATSKIPILGLSSADTSGDKDEAYSAGCDAYEIKPVDVPSFLARVKDLARA